jgi:hypothetical protein
VSKTPIWLIKVDQDVDSLPSGEATRRFSLDKSTIFIYLPWIHRRFIAASYADQVV